MSVWHDSGLYNGCLQWLSRVCVEHLCTTRNACVCLTAVEYVCLRLINNVWGGRGEGEGAVTDGESVCVREGESVRTEKQREQRGRERYRVSEGEENGEWKRGIDCSVFVVFPFLLSVLDKTEQTLRLCVCCFLSGFLDAEGLMGMDTQHGHPALLFTWTQELHWQRYWYTSAHLLYVCLWLWRGNETFSFLFLFS